MNNENKSLSDPSANEIETLEDDETGELKETVEEEQTVTEDFETGDISSREYYFKVARLIFSEFAIFQNRKF